MSSLTTCLRKAGDVLGEEDRAFILERAADLRKAGQSASDAGRAAVAQRLAEVRMLLRAAETTTNAENAAPAPVAESLAPGRSADGDAGVATSQGGGGAATHADPGKPAEPATQAVVAESLQKAAKREQLSPKQMLAEALKLIDEAIARAPDTKDEAKTAPAKATIAVPGDGTFKIVNTKERLREFRALVEKSPGFTGKNAKPRVEKAVTSGDLSPASLAREMLDDGEPLNAIEVLDAAGKPLRFGTSAENDPIVYTDSSSVEVGGMGGFFVGRYWARDKKSAAAKQMAGWAVIDEASGLSAGRGVDKNAALAVAALNLKKPENVKRLEEARQQAEPGLQDAMRVKFREWAEKHQQATFAEQDRIQAQQAAFAAKERERDAFYKSIMGEDAKRPQQSPTNNGWKPEEVKAFLSAAEKAGKAGEAVEFIRDVLPSSSLDAWGSKAIADWEKANTNTFLSTEFGQPIDLKKPPHTVTWDFIEPTVRANRYIAPGARGDAEMSRWKMAHFEAVKAALARGWKVPDKVLYDNARLLREDLNDDDADLASDAMVTTYQQTKDYGKAVQAYRDWKPGVDLKGFEETKDRGNFRLDDDDITVLVERTKTWDGKDRYQARLKNSTNASGPNLTKQQAIDWAANLRDDMRKAAPSEAALDDPAQESAESIARRAEIQDRARAYWDGTATPAIREYLRAFDAFGADRMERNQIKPKGMTARQWLESFVSRQSKWDGSRKVQGTGIEALSAKDLWPTNDGLGERLRKSMLAAVRALKNAPMTSGEMLADAFMEKPAVPAPAPQEPAKPVEAPVSSAAGQKNLAYRGSRIASLLAMNEQIRKLDPTEAWHPDNIKDATDLDALQDSISSTLVRLQREKAKPVEAPVSSVAAMPPIPGIPREAAQRAHAGTSHVPEVRAGQEQDSFRAALADAWSTAMRVAGNDAAAQERVREVFNDVKDGYYARYMRSLEARSRVMSAMIVGPARFPVERNRKRMETERRRAEEASEYLRRGIKRMVRAARGPIDNSPQSELESVRLRLSEREEAQETMKAANVALRKGDDAALEDLGFTAEQIADLKKGDFAGRKGFADYKLSNNNAEIRRLRERLAEAEKRLADAAEGPKATERAGVRIVEDAQDDRLRLFFDDKPSAEVRDALKAAAFKWSPNAGAWQRQLTGNARQAAEAILAKFYPEDGGASLSRITPNQRAVNFDSWAGGLPIVDREDAMTRGFKTGEGVVVEAYHGTARPDRVGTVFQRKRATSGPMAFFTANPTLASSYAQGKEDTSLAQDYEGDYAEWFKVKMPGERSARNIDAAWWALSPEQRSRISDLAPRVTSRENDEGGYDIVLGDESVTAGVGSYDYELQKTARRGFGGGNPLRALVESWLSSAWLYDEEQDFLKVLKLAGFPMDVVDYNNPRAKYPFVYKTYIRMARPLVTSDVPADTMRALEEAAKRDRSRASPIGGDQWDKTTITLREWVEKLKDPERGEYAWTQIPDKVTDVLRAQGYDGIVDWSGKGGGDIVAPVYIPFSEVQVKSALGNKGTFNPDKKDILLKRAAPSIATDQQDGFPTYDNAESGVTIAFPQRTERMEVIEGPGEQVVNYAIMPRDGFEPYGFVELLIRDGVPVSLLDIYVNPEARKLGVARGVLETILAANPGRDLNISNIVEAARDFWERMGIPAQNLEAGAAYDGTLNWETFSQAAYPGRAQGDGREGGQAGEGRDAGTAGEGLAAAGKAAGLNVPELRDLADRMMAGGVTRINVVESVDDMPPARRATVLRSAPDGRVRGAYFHGSDEIYVVARHLHSMQEAAFVVMHEAFHRGLAKTIGPEAKRLLKAMYHTNGKLRQAADAQVKQHKIDLDEAIEEALADMAGEGKARDLRGWQKLVGVIRDWLSRLGDALGLSTEWTDDMVEDFVAGIRREGLRAPVQVSREGDGMAASRGIEERRDQTDTPAFRAWFKDSKVVDAQGGPLVVYHGTANDFSEFKGTTWLAPDAEMAGEYAVIASRLNRGDGANIMPLYAAIKNPAPRSKAGQRFDALKEQGYDGVDMGGGVWVAFRPEQIKSATGNSGAFDPNEADIRLSRAPTIDAIREAKLPAGYIVADLLKSSGKLSWWHKTVGTMHNLAEREPLFRRMYDATQRFLSDVSLYATEAANLAPTLLPKLERLGDLFKSPADAKDVQAVAAPVFEGTLKWTRDDEGNPVETDDVDTAGIRWTDAELRERFKLNDVQVRMYGEFRKATDRSLTDLAASHMVQLGGADTAEVRAAAMAADTPGAAAAILKEHLAEMAERQPARREVLEDTARRIDEVSTRVQDLIRRGYAPLMRFGRYSIDAVDEQGERLFFGLFDTEREANRFARNLQQQFPRARIAQGTMSEQDYKMFAGVSPETVELFGQLLGLDGTGDAESDQAFQAYLKNAKSNRSALRRLIHRQGVAGFNEDAGRVLAAFIYSNARQTAKNLHAGEMGDALMGIKEEKGRGELLDAAIELHQYVSNPTEEAQRLKGVLFAQFLGGSIAAGLVNMTQPYMVTFPYLSQFGGAGRAAMQMRRATADALKDSTGDAALDAAIKRAAEEGIVAPQEVHSLMAQARGAGTLKSGGDLADKASNWTTKLAWMWGRPFALAEQLNRRITFIAAYRLAVDQKMGDPAAFAARAVEETQFTYNKANRPRWARGAVGGLLFTFKQYSISYVELLSRMAASGPEGRRAAAIGLGVLMLTAGMQGLPGADDLDDVIDGLMQRLGYNWSTKQRKREALASLIGDDGAQFLLRGVSGLPGAPIDVANRLGLGNLIPGTGLLTKKADYGRDVAEIAGPVGSLGKQVATAIGAATEGNLRQAGEAILPVAAANLLKAYDMATTGMYRDARGRKVLDVDATDAVAKAIGFQPADVARVQNAAQEVQRTIDLVKARETELADRWARGIFEGDSAAVADARADLAKWNADNPEARISITSKQILQRVKAMASSREDRVRKTAPKEIRAEVGRQLEAAR